MNEKVKKMTKDGEIKSREDLILKIGEELMRVSKDEGFGMDYVTICACALEFLEEILGENYDFPVDIGKIMDELGIEVIYQPLDSEEREHNRPHRVVGRTMKKLNMITKEEVEVVLIDEESLREEQRFAMAHELAHFLIHWNEKKFDSEYCVMPMLFKQVEEMVADIFAIFLLIPLPIFLKEFYMYIGQRPVPVRTSDWLKYLSIVADVPYEDVAIGYQNIRYVFGVIYDRKYYNRKIKADIDEGIKQILDKQLTKIGKEITQEVVDRLFR